MALTCPICGSDTLNNFEYSPNSTHCLTCGNHIPANIFPLFVVTGAGGSGKTAVVPGLRCRLRGNFVVFDKDLLWGRSGDHFYNNWLRLTYSIAQGSHYTILAGIIRPEDFDNSEDRGLVGNIHYVNLHCNDIVREERLRARPPWRQCNEWFIEEHKRVAQQLLGLSAACPALRMITIDTSHIPTSNVVKAIYCWIKRELHNYPSTKPAQFSSTN